MLGYLREVIEIPNETIQIKVLQTILLLINPKLFDLRNWKVIESVPYPVALLTDSYFLALLPEFPALRVEEPAHQEHKLSDYLPAIRYRL